VPKARTQEKEALDKSKYMPKERKKGDVVTAALVN
jgi:hypothetical protein